jgi:NADPH-dependent 2,4-dienoyl-CoA reductase/sulfur reductase-like enzyme/nitrite reductase/ring-hydroxylating ferredoxin subunit
VGHVGDDAVLVVDAGGALFAIGAHCTHYRGPLVDGLVVGDTVRCPWHHACFHLRTGAALRPPALDPVTRWRVETDGDRVFVRVPEAAHEAPVALPAPPASVVIIGGGAAGLSAAGTLRAEGYEGPITIISADTDAPYDRPNLSKDYLAGKAPEDWMPLRDDEYYRSQRITLRQNTRVTAVDTARRRLTLEGGATEDYGALLLAVGAEPIRLNVPGADLPHVRYLRSFADTRAIIAALGDGTRAVVVGASFIGLEVAASLRMRGVDVHVVAPEARPMEKTLGPEAGDYIRSVHEAHGVVFHLGQTVAAVDAGAVRLTSGERIPANLVIAGIGVRPAVGFLESSGIAQDRGVTVNEYLETSAPGVFAAGDIARWPDPHTGDRIRVEHWVLAERQGQAAARNILGRRERFDAVPFFWSQHYDVVFNYVGHAEQWDAIDRDGSLDGQDCRLTYRRAGRTLAVVTVGRDLESLECEVALERDAADATA